MAGDKDDRTAQLDRLLQLPRVKVGDVSIFKGISGRVDWCCPTWDIFDAAMCECIRNSGPRDNVSLPVVKTIGTMMMQRAASTAGSQRKEAGERREPG